MKTMTRFFNGLILLVGISFTACKKYEDGPMLSLKSKNKRLIGDWEMVAYEGGYTEESETSYNFWGTSMNYSENYEVIHNFNDGVLTSEVTEYYSDGSYTEDTTYTIEESLEMNLSIGDDSMYEMSSMADSSSTSSTEARTWVDGKSNKEMIELMGMGTFDILKLTKEELIIESTSGREYSTNYTHSQDKMAEEIKSKYTFKKK